MQVKFSPLVVLVVAALLAAVSGWAQEAIAPPAPDAAPAAHPAKTYSQQELDQILAPIALYPDALLAQILMASTYPLEVVEAARWVKANPDIKEQALEEAMQSQTWDPAVKALTAVPQVLEQMHDKLDWTQKLGDAFLAQQQDVMNTVQALRAKAKNTGNLESSAEQVVKEEQEGDKTVYVVESSSPDVVYVPIYNPYVVYGVWWYPYPPYYLHPPHYVYPPHVAFTAGIFVGAAIWGHCNWHGGYVSVNVTHYNSFNRTHIDNPNWNHQVDHRRGVPYRDPAVAQRYNRGVNDQAARARDDFRGRAETGRAELRDMDRSQLQNRAAPTYDRGGTDARSTGFSGADSGAATRAASSRGAASRGGMSRGGGGGRGGRR